MVTMGVAEAESQTIGTRSETHVDGGQLAEKIALWGLIGKAVTEAIWPLRKFLVRALGGTINGNGHAIVAESHDRRRSDGQIAQLSALVQSLAANVQQYHEESVRMQDKSDIFGDRILKLEIWKESAHQGSR